MERSLLTELPHFDITKQLPQDIMHVLLEGSVQYAVRSTMQQVFDCGFLMLAQLNKFSQLTLGYLDEMNRPPPLRETTFNGQETYKMCLTVEQAIIFLKYLPFALKGFVPVEDHFYQLLVRDHLNCADVFLPCYKPAKNPGTTRCHRIPFKEFQEAVSNSKYYTEDARHGSHSSADVTAWTSGSTQLPSV